MDAPVLIAGAGPTGLAAAVFLHQRGVACRLFDKAAQAASTSRALAVNPRTLDLLEPTGVTARIVAEGRPAKAFELRRPDRTLVRIDLAAIDTAFPMTVLPQARTEALLTQALAERGIAPERGVEVALLGQDETGVRVRLDREDGAGEAVSGRLLLAADGAHSKVRHALGLGFPGDAFPESWELADVVYEGPVEAPEGYVELHPRGLVFALAFDPAQTAWRYMSTVGDPVVAGPPGAPPIHDVTWRTAFRISHRVAEKLSVGRVALAGDAAHLHSPVGARGMNLGIEDAFVFAACAADALAEGGLSRLADYGRLRHHADAGVVRRVEAITRMARGEGAFSLVRRIVPPLAGRVKPLRDLIRRTAVGLDHPVRLS